VLKTDEAGAARALEELRLRNAQLESASRELDDLTHAVSHELRVPLRQVADILHNFWAHPRLDEESRRHLVGLSEATDRMGRMLDALLVLARRSQAPLQLTDVDHGGLVADIIREGRFRGARERIEWEVAPLLRAPGDPALLQQVWFNLIENAVKFSREAQPPRIEIGSQPAAGESVFYVRDNGVGFDMQRAGRLFRVFERLHPPIWFEGIGVGLAVVRRIVSRHGGRTWSEASPGFGATFHFTLPSAPAL
jgi:light-regulated signal transduction histidine kinase (bacteriophytochrome)